MSKKVRRLFAGFAPKHYEIELDPDRETMVLQGSVTISGQKAGRPSQRLTFHQNGLKIESAEIVRNDRKRNQEFSVTRINHHNGTDEVRLHTKEQLYPGQYTVRMKFSGNLTRSLEGIYPSNFIHKGQEKKIMVSQFESHYAREAFPCIDEPEAKATFELTMITPKDETVLSNTPIKHQANADSQVVNSKLKTTFETTPRMSTYLLAFVYGKLDFKEAKTKHGVLVRAYATPDNVGFTGFALKNAVDILEFYTDYFDIPYPLPKLDLVALPDFAAAAMENWGVVTFREQSLLLDPDNTSLAVKQHIAMVVSHELSHQWFGNLVTMRWWTDLWLNEGFANWMEYLALVAQYPEWHMWVQYIVDEQQLGLKLDALVNTHPIQVPIDHPDEISTIFDAISYEKGGSTINMLAKYLGHETFRDGLRYYLEKHAYSNTDTIDLWDALETVSHKPVKSFMATWTSQIGYPLVRANVTESQVELTQERFLINPLARGKEAVDQPVWPIPLVAGDELPEMFDTPQMSYSISNPEKFKINDEQSGFYRVVYNPSHVARLAGLVRRGRLSPLNRLGILADAFEAAKAGYMDTATSLSLMESYQNEDNNAVWDIIATNLSAIRNIMHDDELRESMKQYVRNLVSKQLKRLGWNAHDGESHFDTLLRPTIIALAAISDEPSIVDEALKRFNKMNRSEDLPPDLRGVIYTTAARHGNSKTFDKLLDLHNTTASSEERVTLAVALTNFEQLPLINKALTIITTDAVRLQDVMYWVAYSFSNRFARDAAWKWLKTNWSWLDENIGKDLSFYRMPIYAARSYSDAAFLKEYKMFFDSVMRPALERSIKQGIEMIEWQSEWKKRDLKLIKKFFAN